MACMACTCPSPLCLHNLSVAHVNLRCTGKLPLIEQEAEGAEALKARGVDCLTIFLMPTSQEAHEARVRAWLTESDDEIAARQVRARARWDGSRRLLAQVPAVCCAGERKCCNPAPQPASSHCIRIVHTPVDSRCR